MNGDYAKKRTVVKKLVLLVRMHTYASANWPPVAT